MRVVWENTVRIRALPRALRRARTGQSPRCSARRAVLPSATEPHPSYENCIAAPRGARWNKAAAGRPREERNTPKRTPARSPRGSGCQTLLRSQTLRWTPSTRDLG
jgi:hypothetical protein